MSRHTLVYLASDTTINNLEATQADQHSCKITHESELSGF